jgi:hypothetical protein
MHLPIWGITILSHERQKLVVATRRHGLVPLSQLVYIPLNQKSPPVNELQMLLTEQGVPRKLDCRAATGRTATHRETAGAARNARTGAAKLRRAILPCACILFKALVLGAPDGFGPHHKLSDGWPTWHNLRKFRRSDKPSGLKCRKQGFDYVGLWTPYVILRRSGHAYAHPGTSDRVHSVPCRKNLHVSGYRSDVRTLFWAPS